MLFAKTKWHKLLTAVALCAVLTVVAWTFGQDKPVSDPKSASKPLPLVNADPDVATYLDKIETLLNEKSYDDALRMIQDMLDKGRNLGFYDKDANGRNYESVLSCVNKLLAQMDADGLARYRSLNDPPAGQLYKEALAGSDLGKLQLVADRYRLTNFGPKALDALGAIYFDTGRFYQAAACWRNLLRISPDDPAAPVLQTKIAAALYLAGESKLGDDAAEQLKKNFPNAVAAVYGREQNLSEFLQSIKALPAIKIQTTSNVVGGGWPGWGGVPNGLRPMDEANVTLAPRWFFTAKPSEELKGNITGSLLVAKESLGIQSEQYSGLRTIIEFRDGHLRIQRVQSNDNSMGPGAGYPFNTKASDMLPSLIHPVVFEDKVIVRTADRIVARDLLDGEVRWSTGSMVMQHPNVNVGYYGYQQGKMADTGRYALTVGNGKIFGLSDFRQTTPSNTGMGVPAQPANSDKSKDGSRLVAVWASNGKLVNGWEVGAGKGDDEVIRNCIFVSAPTYSDGRLYVLAVYMNSGYYLLCLSADDGRLIWKQFLSQAPPPPAGYGQQVHIGSLPAVSDDKVYALTNAGVLGAFDAGSGQPLWAYQYDATSDDATMNVRRGLPISGPQYGGSPLVVTRGRVICLPADSDKVMALSCDDGSVIWSVSRDKQADLTGIDEDRILISGDGLKVLSAADGLNLANIPVKGVNGRPAVSSKSIMASGSGEFYRVSLEDYRLTIIAVPDPNAILGNLVTVDGKLIAANAAGVCAYFGYDEVRRRMAQKIKDALPADKPAVMLNSGQMALNSRQFADAIGDMQAALNLAQKQGDEALAARISSALCRAYMNAGNGAQTPQEMIEQFNKAIGYAATDLEKSLMKLRLAKAYAHAGQFDKAVACAQDIIEKYGRNDITDVEIGPKALETSAGEAIKNNTAKGGALAKRYIDQYIQKGGRSCYKLYDAQADEALKSAAAKGDMESLCAIENRWPNANCLNEAFFLAAELAYKSAQGKPTDQAQPLLNQAIRFLERACNNPSSPRSVSATVALAMIYARGTTAWYAVSLTEGLRDLPPNTEVAFADIRGKLGDMLAKIDSGNVPKLPAELCDSSFVDLPVSELFTMNAVSTVLLRDHNLRPIRIGDSLAAIQGNRVILLDTMADNDRNAVRWNGIVGIDASRTSRRNQQQVPVLVGGLSNDGKYMYVADDDSVTALEVATAKIKWQKNLAEFNMAAPAVMSIGGNRMVTVSAGGKVSCMDLDKGDFVWRGQLPADKASSDGRLTISSIGVPQIGGGVVAIAFNNRSLACYSLFSGKMLAKWDSNNNNVDVMFNPAGQLLTIVDGELACRDPGQLSKPIWTRNYPNKNPGLLAVDGDRIAVASLRNGNEIEIISIRGDGKLISKFTTTGGNASPTEACFEGDNFYVIELNAQILPRRVAALRQITVQAAHIEKFQIQGKGGSLWKKPIPCDNGGSVVPTLDAGPDQVIVASRAVGQNSPGFAYMFDAAKGETVGKFPLGRMKLSNVPNYAARLSFYGAPVMTNGRLCVETYEGVTIYGK